MTENLVAGFSDIFLLPCSDISNFGLHPPPDITFKVPTPTIQRRQFTVLFDSIGFVYLYFFPFGCCCFITSQDVIAVLTLWCQCHSLDSLKECSPTHSSLGSCKWLHSVTVGDVGDVVVVVAVLGVVVIVRVACSCCFCCHFEGKFHIYCIILQMHA